MTILVAIVSDEVHTEALRKARELGGSGTLAYGNLHAPLDDEMRRWAVEIWDSIEGALGRACRQGMEAAQEMLDRVSNQLKELAEKLPKRAEEVRTYLLERLDIYLRLSVEGALRRVQREIVIGESKLVMTRVTLEERVKLSGSLKASLAEICAFVADGEIALSAEYQLTSATSV